MKKVEDHNSSIGNLKANQICLIAYIGGALLSFIPFMRYFAWVVPLVIYFLEKQSNFVRKNAVQATGLYAVTSLVLFVINIVIYEIVFSNLWYNPYTVLASLATISAISVVFLLIITAITIITLIKLWKYEEYTIPLIGKLFLKFGKDISIDDTKANT